MMKEKSRTHIDIGNGSGERPDSAAPARFQIDHWVVDPVTNRMARGDQTIRLEPKVMDLLAYLAERPGTLVTRGNIEEDVWAGVTVGYDTVTGAIQKLRKAFGDDARNPRVIETVPKKGYRLLAPVQPYVEPDTFMAETGAPAAMPRTTRPWIWAGIAAVLVMALAGAVLLLMPGAPDSTNEAAVSDADSRTIAVLPFENPGGDPDQAYFADGLADDVITGLAKNPRLLVIARDSSFLYRDSQIDIRQVAEALKVRYLLRGTVRRFGDRIRVNAQLVDASTGAHAWAEQFDGTTREIFSLQSSITRGIETALSVRASTGARQDLGLPATKIPEAYDSFLQGRYHFYQFANKAENAKARALFRAAVEHDPTFALAYAMLAWTQAFDAMNGWSENRDESLARAKQLAGKALALHQALPLAYFVRGLAYREQGEYVKALVEAETAIRHDSNYANAHVLLATLLYYAGRPGDGLERIRKAIRLNPHHPYNYSFHLGQAYYVLGRYAEAIEAFRKGIDTNPASERLHVWLAASFAQSGQSDKAEWEAEEVRAINPAFSISRMEKTFPFKEKKDRERFLEGLRKAGFTQ